MNKKTYWAIAVGLVLVVVIAAVWWWSKPPTSPNRLVVGVLSWPGDGPIYIGDEKGFFAEEGVELEIQLIESYDSRRAALVAGQIHIDCNTLDQLIIYAESGVEARVFGLSDFSAGGDGIIAKRDIQDLADLKGRTVVFAEASPSEFFLRYLLEDKGVPISEIDLQPVADAQAAGTAILAKQVDAGVTYEPWLTKSKDDPELHVLASTSEYPNLIPGLFIGTREDLEKRSDVYRGFMRAWFRSVEYYRNNPEEANRIMARRMNLSVEELKSVLSQITILGLEQNRSMFSRESSPNLFDLVLKISEFWKEAGFSTKQHDGADMITPIVE